jgi:SAM-dependent methyltransferase
MATSSEPRRWLIDPFVMGSVDTFTRAREFLQRIEFTEQQICNATGVSSIYEMRPLDAREKGFTDLADPLSVAVRLLIDGEAIPWTDVRRQWSSEDVECLQRLGVIRDSLSDENLCRATVALYPNERLYIASERHVAIDAFATGVPADIVYSTLTAESRRFLELMPRRQCDDYLELCSGAGVAALVAARDFAGRAWAVDITARSTRFARFNAALNGLTNVTPLEGDLYSPVAGQRFDLITAHPPYMPSFETQMVFRDGGDDGEQVTRRIIAGLPEHLRPGGQFYCDCMMSDRTNSPLEMRIREMLGPAHEEFDIVLGSAGTFDPMEYYAQRLAAGTNTPDDFLRRRGLFNTLGVEQFVNAVFLIERRREKQAPVTRRRVLSGETTADDLQWYMSWATSTAAWGKDVERFLDARPRRSPHVELRSRSVFRDRRWSVTGMSVSTLSPFAAEAACASWFATLLSWLDGRATVREHFARLRDTGLIPEASSDADFATLVGQLADGGFIELDLFPWPAKHHEHLA